MDNRAMGFKDHLQAFIDSLLALVGLARLGYCIDHETTLTEIEDNARKVIEYETLLYELDSTMRADGLSVLIDYYPPRWNAYSPVDKHLYVFPDHWELGKYASIPEQPEVE